MARGGVTYTEVDEAAQYLQGIGRNPTVDAIRERLGTGSRTTLAEHLKRWKSLQADGEGHLPKPLLALVSGLWDSLQSQAAQRIQENQSSADQEVAAIKSQFQMAQQNNTQLSQKLHQLQETLDAEQRTKSALETQLQTTERSYDKLNAINQSVMQQLDNAKLDNQRLHQLAMQIQANLEHYQQAIQQQQLEQNLTKEKQHAAYTHELTQFKIELGKASARAEQSEKTLATSELQLQQIQKNYEALVTQHEKLLVKCQEVERVNIQYETQVHLEQAELQKLETELSAAQQLMQVLHEKIAVQTSQFHQAKIDLHQAHDKIETLRQEKQFLAQEKAQLNEMLKSFKGNCVIENEIG